MSSFILDTECYKDYFLLLIRDIETGVTAGCEMYPGKPFDMKAFPPATYISFNGINYDFPILSLALGGADNSVLKAASDDIILTQLKPWHVADKYGGIDLRGVDHIDLIEVAPGQCGLKAYGGRLNSKRLQDLPIDPSASISPSDRQILIEYCGNDLETTLDLYRKLTPQIELRTAMSKEFGIDLRSKSDAQIAEAVIRSEVEKRVGHRVFRPEIHPEYKFNYQVPAFIAFSSPGMNTVLNVIRNTVFSLTEKGSVEMPQSLESMRVRIGASVYTMGIGGLHSNESSVVHKADAQFRLFDKDVKGYYPNLMITQRVCPPAMGENFLIVFEGLVHRREVAKAAKNVDMDAGLKTTTVSCFGKFGSKWSTLYGPSELIQVTLTGQLSLLMLIETVESVGFVVISANTDGIVIKCPVGREDELNAIISAWEIVSGLQMEETEYSAIYSKDVNNYIAIKPDGSVKQKGIYSFVGSKKSELEKNPTNFICVDAVIEYLSNGVVPEQTIRECKDVRRFLTLRQVKGGAQYDGEYLGKAVRWYYAEGEARHITYATNGNKVARSDGARPLMTLPDTLPDDIDYDWYVNECRDILADIGA